MMKRETGAITLYVTIVCLFIIIVAIAGYIQISNKQAAQIGQLKEIERSYESQITLEDVYKGYAGGEIIHINTEEELLKIGSNEDVYINGKIYTFGSNCTYELEKDFEITGSFREVAQKIKDEQILINGNNHTIKAINEKGIEEYYTKYSKYYIATNKYGYVLDGLELYYDGIDNTGTGEHSLTTTTWKDLSGNNRDGSLKNITPSSAWTNDGLTFDGVDDYVLIQEMNYDNVTLEAGVESQKINSTDSEIILGNFENGGYGIYYTSRIAFEVWINEKNGYVTPKHESYRAMHILQGNKYSISGFYNGRKVFGRINGQYQYTDIEGTIKVPEKNTKFILGSNPIGEVSSGQGFLGTIYTARVYSKALSDEEMSVNYLNDIDRYNL